LRCLPEDFEVCEELGFEPDGEGEHALLQIEKRELNTADVCRELARLSGVAQRDIGYSGMKDRNALTQQWFSVGLAGAAEPEWRSLDGARLRVMAVSRHRRKLRRGVHRRNRFRLRLKQLQGDRDALAERLGLISRQGAPNYFGEQRFGRDAANLVRARAWLSGQSRRPRRQQQGILLSAARAFLFNTLLAQRVSSGEWQQPGPGDVCLLAGSHSFFRCEEGDPDIADRVRRGDIHLGLPLWGGGRPESSETVQECEQQILAPWRELSEGLVEQGAKLQYRPARLLADDFCWEFCDDSELLLSFALPAGSYATALVRELVQYRDQSQQRSETCSEQP
jgi:tRNA pseudouridine13 synthase